MPDICRIPLILLITLAAIGCNRDDNGGNEADFSYPAGGFSSLQSLVNHVPDNARILVDAGLYRETVEVRNKGVEIIGESRQSIIDGGGESCVSAIDADGTVIRGFTFINCNDGVFSVSTIEVRDNYFFNNTDGVDFDRGGSGVIANNKFYNQKDDGIDFDDEVVAEVYGNTIVDSADDGIEIRLNPHTGDRLIVTIKNNYFYNNANGIQFIDYETDSERYYEVTDNFFQGNDFNDISYSDNINTVPSVLIGEISEAVFISGNLFHPEQFSFSGGGDNTTLQQNIFLSASADGNLNTLPQLNVQDNTFITNF